MLTPTHLKSLQALELAVRTGSLKRAAERLAITPAAVGQRIKAIEEYLGIELLVRGSTGLQVTPALSVAINDLQTAFRELELVAGALDMQRGHDIHLAAPSDFVEMWLRPRLLTFGRAHPNIRFCISGEGEAPIRLAGVDCEIMFTARHPEGSGFFELFADYVVPLCSSENTRRILKAPARHRLEGFPLVHLDFYREDPTVPNWAMWARSRRLARSAPERGMRFKRISPAIDAVKAHAGITLCGLALIKPMIDDGVLSMPFSISTGTWTHHVFQARFRNDALVRPQVRRFKDWLLQEADLTLQWLRQKVKRRATVGAS